MHNLHLEFAYPWAPWLFFLLVPALLLTLIPYFRINKKYRRTRNRVISIVLHVLVVTLAVCVLTGLTFVYEVSNPDNEIMFVVDVSDTEDQAHETRDQYLQSLLEDSGYDGFKVGVVTFGFTQVYAVPLTYDTGSAFESYCAAELPDVSATDIAAALRFANAQLTSPQTAKIVLVTDGKQTDENAVSVIGSIAAQGTRIDTVYVPSDFPEDFVQVTNVEFPDFHINPGDDCPITVTLQSKMQTAGSVVELYDNGEKDEESIQTLGLTPGAQSITFHKTFEEDGLHEIKIKITDGLDGMSQNNEFCSYIYLELFNHVLILEQADESGALKEVLETDDAYKVDVINLTESTEIPETVEDLRAYDQVILNNIANSDLQPYHLDTLLYSYVYDYGGGLFTVGGSDQNGEAHAYRREDMRNTVFQQMLPVQIIDYTPPVGVMVIIDVSGSMKTPWTDGIQALDWAKQGAIACLGALTERDYFGIVTLDTEYKMVLEPTPCTRESYIKEVINNIDGDGGTLYSRAISRAGQALTNLGQVDRKHIVLVSDGLPSGSDKEKYLETVKGFYDSQGITLSVVGIGVTEGSPAEVTLKELVETGHGRLHTALEGGTLIQEMREDLNAPEIKEVIDEPFNPQINDILSPLVNGVQYGVIEDEEGNVVSRALNAQLGGFYGAKVRTGIKPVLVGEYQVPLYAQWKFGKGSVGSFMSDLNGRWSSQFLADADALTFLFNVISNLMPMEDIRPNELNVQLNGDNYINQLTVYTTLEEGQAIRASVENTETKEVISLNELTDLTVMQNPSWYVQLAMTAENQYTRSNFIIKQKGTYRILVEKTDAEGTVIASEELYKAFSYSLEYDQNAGEEDPSVMLSEIAERGNGSMIMGEEDLYRIFEDFLTALVKSFDPRWLFMILAIVLFLLDIAVRKFKFKWIHELVRDHKEKKAQKANERRP